MTHIKKKIDKHDINIQPIFVINKIDQLAIDRDESPKALVDRCRGYLIGLGFVDPIIIPTSSSYSLEIRETIKTAQRMTTKEVAGEYRGAAKLKSLFSRRYKTSTTFRQQHYLASYLHLFMDFEKSYYEALTNSKKVKSIVDSTNIKSMPNHRRIHICPNNFQNGVTS